MTAASLAVIGSYYDAFNARDWDGFFALLHDDVAHDLNQGPRETGKAGFRLFMDRMNRCYRENLTDLVVFASPDGRRAAAEFIVNGTYTATDKGLPDASGQTYRLPGGAFFAIEARVIVRVTNYYNLEDWLAQVRAPTPGRTEEAEPWANRISRD